MIGNPTVMDGGDFDPPAWLHNRHLQSIVPSLPLRRPQVARRCRSLIEASTAEVIDRATHVIDIHCGDGNEWLRPYSYWVVTGAPAVVAASRDLALAFGLDHIHADGPLLTETPAAADTLVILLEAMRRKERDMRAVLEIQAPCADLRLSHEHPRPTVRKRDHAILFAFVGVRALDLHAVWNQPLE